MSNTCTPEFDFFEGYNGAKCGEDKCIRTTKIKISVPDCGKADVYFDLTYKIEIAENEYRDFLINYGLVHVDDGEKIVTHDYELKNSQAIDEITISGVICNCND